MPKFKEVMLQGEDGKEYSLSAVVSEETQAQLKELGVVGEDGKLKTVELPAEIKEEVDAKVKRAEVSANFIKSISVPESRHKEFGVKAITTETSSMGYSMPTELAGAILEKKEQSSKVRARSFVFQMSGNFDLAVENVAVTGYWVSDNTAITESSPTLAKKFFNDNYVAARVLLPWQLLNATPIAIENYISSLMGRKLARAEEEKFIGGDGTTYPLGIRDSGSSITSLDQASTALVIGDVKKLFYALPEVYRQNASFLSSTNGKLIVDSLKDTQGRPLFPVEQALDMLFKKPFDESDHIPANLGTGTDETEIYFGDFNYYWIKEGTSLTMASMPKISNLQTELVAYQAVDGGVTIADAFRVLKKVK